MSEEQTDGKHDHLLKDFLPQLKNFIQSETVFGAPYEVGDVTIIPVNSVKVGFAFGDGKVVKNNKGSAGGGGVLMKPVAFLIIRDGTVTLQNLQSGTIENVLEKVPDVLEKVTRLIKKMTDKKEE